MFIMCCSLQTSGVDYQHAVIEFSDQEECFVLQDLNTSQGTFVNECRVQNAAVRLAPGDVIRFGSASITYELEVENPAQVSLTYTILYYTILYYTILY